MFASSSDWLKGSRDVQGFSTSILEFLGKKWVPLRTDADWSKVNALHGHCEPSEPACVLLAHPKFCWFTLCYVRKIPEIIRASAHDKHCPSPELLPSLKSRTFNSLGFDSLASVALRLNGFRSVDDDVILLVFQAKPQIKRRKSVERRMLDPPCEGILISSGSRRKRIQHNWRGR